jgi:hypothetical protein
MLVIQFLTVLSLLSEGLGVEMPKRLAGNKRSGLSPAYRSSFAAIAVSEYRE